MGTVLALAAAGGLARASPASAEQPTGLQPTAVSHKCARGFVHAIIARKHTCLKVGQRCDRRKDRQYHRYGFHCHTGKLARAKPKPPPTQPIGRVVAEIRLVGTATDVDVGEGAVWVRVDAGGFPTLGESVQRIDPATNASTASIAVGEGRGLAAGNGALWATDFEGGTMSRIGVATNAVVASIPLRGKFPTYAATSPGAVWVSMLNPDGVPSWIERIDPATNGVVATIEEPSADVAAGGIAFGAGSLWASGLPASVRVDPSTNAIVAHVSEARGCGGVAADSLAVWFADGGNCGAPHGEGLFRVDPTDNSFVTRIPVGSGPALDVAIASGSAWATSFAAPYVLARIDPQTNRVAGTLSISGRGSVAAGFGALWVAAGNTLLRVEPLP